ncbi:tRNA N6-adenosine threonylcarbamoyltransferase, mitochondrial [Methylobacterium soli]|uniref:MFS transporter small subunit n=1 Tax=Methylobacterium soli TaxID=553447 RepID=UPI00208B37EB|nr:MFS transporter [Methylobacterium soli]GJE45819.1 tRNA N6-adenosine threonylcarbamoyltransferase, mitochondrial [Methylobacterium soli]
MNVLGIETTCDETATAIVAPGEDGRGLIRANEVLSQIAEHAAYGGVVPEIAARAHVEVLDRLIARALDTAGMRLADLDGIAVAAGPGLIGGVLIGLPGVGFGALDAGQKAQIAAIAAGFVGLLSLFNILGRFFWASLSDRIGRKVTYATFFALGGLLYAAAPWAAGIGSQALFVGFFCIILSMYGGGFATIPAYLADVFGTQFVGAIHGRLLTAWSTAGIVGPFVVTKIREVQAAAGVQGADLYGRTLYILAGFLAVGFVANLLIRPLARHWFMEEADVAALETKSAAAGAIASGSFGIGRGGLSAPAMLAWAVVGLPILWGIWITLSKALILFR